MVSNNWSGNKTGMEIKLKQGTVNDIILYNDWGWR
jgi:hypothetical protein